MPGHMDVRVFILSGHSRGFSYCFPEPEEFIEEGTAMGLGAECLAGFYFSSGEPVAQFAVIEDDILIHLG